MSHTIQINNARALTKHGLQEQTVLIRDGQWLDIGNSPDKIDDIIDAQGKLLTPALCALGVRANNWQHIVQQANLSGIGTLTLQPDSFGAINDQSAITQTWQQHCQNIKSPINAILLGACTQQLEGKQLSEMAALMDAGCAALSDGGRAWHGQHVLKRTLQYAASLGIRLHVNAQNASLTDGGCAHNGSTAQRLGLSPIPVSAETSALATLIELSNEAGCALHINHISSARGAEQLARAKADGLDITADVSIHHLLLNETAIDGFNTLCHIQPPLRAESDRIALIEALKNGVIDAISAHHQPFSFDDKHAPFPSAKPGIAALELLLPLTLQLVEQKALSLELALNAITHNAARCVGLEATQWILIDTEAATSSENTTYSTPYQGWALSGKVMRRG